MLTRQEAELHFQPAFQKANCKKLHEYANFRSRMQEEKYQKIFKQRPSIGENPNAVCRNRGLQQFNVRGMVKAKAVVLLHALAYNLTRMLNLGIIAS